MQEHSRRQGQGHMDHQFAGRGDRVASGIARSSQGNQRDQQDFTQAGSSQDRSMQEHSHRQGQDHRDHQVAGRGDRDASRIDRLSQEDQQDQQDFTRAARQDRSMQEHSHRQGGQSKGSHNLKNCARRVAAKSSKERQRLSGDGAETAEWKRDRMETATKIPADIHTAAAAGEQQQQQDGRQQQPQAQVCEKETATTTAGTGTMSYADVTASGNGTATERAAGSQIATANARQQQQQQQQSRQLQRPPTGEMTMEGADAEATEVAATTRNNTRTGNAASQAAQTHKK